MIRAARFMVLSIFAVLMCAVSVRAQEVKGVEGVSPSQQGEDPIDGADSANSHGQDPNYAYDLYRYRIYETLENVRTAGEASCPECNVNTQAGESTQAKRCEDNYRKLYEHDEVDMRVVFGYLDFKKDTDDIYAASAYIDRLTARCRPGASACGFKRDPDDMEVFYKLVPGPDGRMKRVRLTVAWSSATGSETLNRGENEAEQTAQSQHAEDVFFSGLYQADVLMYVGHARNGGGPDFSPPLINPQTRRTDLDWYLQNKPGANRMYKALRNSRTPPKLLGMFACFATNKFGPKLKSSAPKTGLVLSDRSEFESIVAQSYMTLDSTLSLKCEDDFKRAVNSVHDVNGYEIGPVQVSGLFEKKKKKIKSLMDLFN